MDGRHRLYRLHPLSQELDFPPLTTLDTDIAVPQKLRVDNEDLHDRLKANGFTEEFLGTNRPPATHYMLGEDSGGFYAEFLTPLIGGVENRGKPTTTVSVAGVTSQKLRYLELLLNKPWQIGLSESVGFPTQQLTTIQIPNAASYLAQKLLVHERRESKERAKHVIYIHDTIQTFGGSLLRLQHEWLENVKPMLPARAVIKVMHSADKLFGEVTDTIRNATIEAAATGRNVTAPEIRDVCHTGLKQIFV